MRGWATRLADRQSTVTGAPDASDATANFVKTSSG
jgi:hypothetical protein